MAESYTSRTGLIQPARDLSTPVDIDKINANMASIDGDLGALMVANDVIPGPTELYDGQVVKEITSGKVWVAQKQLNGTYLRKFITYPWYINAKTSNTGVAVQNNGLYQKFGTANFISGLNSSQASIDGSGFIIIPEPGVYTGYYHVRCDNVPESFMFQSAICINNASVTAEGTEALQKTTAGQRCAHTMPINQFFNKNDTVGWWAFNGSPGAKAYITNVFLSLSQPKV